MLSRKAIIKSPQKVNKTRIDQVIRHSIRRKELFESIFERIKSKTPLTSSEKRGLMSLIKDNPAVYTKLLGKHIEPIMKTFNAQESELFGSRLNGKSGYFFKGLGPNVEFFARGLGKNIEYFTKGLGPDVFFMVGLERYASDFARGLGVNAGDFARGLGTNADQFILGMRRSMTDFLTELVKNKNISVFIKNLDNPKDFLTNLVTTEAVQKNADMLFFNEYNKIIKNKSTEPSLAIKPRQKPKFNTKR